MALRNLFRIHLLTALILMVVASFLLHKNLDKRSSNAYYYSYGAETTRERLSKRGWPLDMWFVIETIPGGLSPEQETIAVPVNPDRSEGRWDKDYEWLANLGIALAMLIFVAVFVEWFIGTQQQDFNRLPRFLNLHTSTIGLICVVLIAIGLLNVGENWYMSGWPLQILSYGSLSVPALILNMTAWLVFLACLALVFEGKITQPDSTLALRRLAGFCVVAALAYVFLVKGEYSNEKVFNGYWYNDQLVHKTGWPLQFVTHLPYSKSSRTIEAALLFGTWNVKALCVNVAALIAFSAATFWLLFKRRTPAKFA